MSTIYEFIILFGVVFFFAYAFSAATHFTSGQPAPDLPSALPQEGLRLAFQLYLTGVLGVYFVWFWSRGRRTLPMKTMGVGLRRLDGGPVGTGRAVLRYAIASLLFWGLLALVWQLAWWLLPLWTLPWLWALADRDHQTLYDRLSGTRLVLDPVQGVGRKTS